MAATSSEESLISMENDIYGKHEYEANGDSSSTDLIRLDADMNEIVVSHINTLCFTLIIFLVFVLYSPPYKITVCIRSKFIHCIVSILFGNMKRTHVLDTVI